MFVSHNYVCSQKQISASAYLACNLGQPISNFSSDKWPSKIFQSIVIHLIVIIGNPNHNILYIYYINIIYIIYTSFLNKVFLKVKSLKNIYILPFPLLIQICERNIRALRY